MPTANQKHWYQEIADKHRKRRRRKRFCITTDTRLPADLPCTCTACAISVAIKYVTQQECVPESVLECIGIVNAQTARTVGGHLVCLRQATLVVRVYALLPPQERSVFGCSAQVAVRRALVLIEYGMIERKAYADK